MATKNPYPERRKSALAQMSPVSPAVEVEAPVPEPVKSTPPEAKDAPVKTKPVKESTEGEAPQKLWPPKTSFYQNSDDGGRMRAAFVNTQMQEEVSSLSEFIGNAIAREVERLEALYNEGNPWPAVHPRQVPKGPPRRWTT